MCRDDAPINAIYFYFGTSQIAAGLEYKQDLIESKQAPLASRLN